MHGQVLKLPSVVLLIGFLPSSALACERGYQQWHATRSVVCLPDKMVSYLACLESVGAGQINIEKDDSTNGSRKFTLGLSGEGSGLLAKGYGKVHIDASNTDTAIHQIKQQFDPKNNTNCLRAAFSGDAIENRPRSNVVTSRNHAATDRPQQIATLTPPSVQIEKVVPYPIVLRRDEPMPLGFEEISPTIKLSEVKLKFPNGIISHSSYFEVGLAKEVIPFERAIFYFRHDSDNPSAYLVCLFFRNPRDYKVVKDQAVAIFGMSPNVSRMGGKILVWENMKKAMVKLDEDSYCVSS